MKKLLALCLALCVAGGFGTAYAKSPDTPKHRHATHSAKSSHSKHAAHKHSAKKSSHKKSHGKHHQA